MVIVAWGSSDPSWFRFATIGGLGHGLDRAKRLVERFEIASIPGMVMTICIARWK